MRNGIHLATVALLTAPIAAISRATIVDAATWATGITTMTTTVFKEHLINALDLIWIEIVNGNNTSPSNGYLVQILERLLEWKSPTKRQWQSRWKSLRTSFSFQLLLIIKENGTVKFECLDLKIKNWFYLKLKLIYTNSLTREIRS